MIKLVGFLRRHRSFVFMFLALPLVGLILGGRFKLDVLPEREFPTFEVVFSSPGIQAEENLRRVTEVVERVFNGVPGLLHLQSVTRDERVSVSLIFHKKLERDEATLFLQERIDRVKLELPRDVARIEVNAIEYPVPADLLIEFSQPISTAELRRALGPLIDGITKSVPDLSQKAEILVTPDPDALNREKLPLSQVLQSLRASGVLASLGEKAGIVYQLGSTFSSLDELRAVIVGARGHRPVTLQQVAKIELRPSPRDNKLSLWIDPTRERISDYSDRLRELDPGSRVTKGARAGVIDMLLLPALGLAVILGLQTLFARIVFRGWSMLWLMLVFDLLLGSHFFFWLIRTRGKVTLPDLTACLLAMSVGTMYFLLLFTRIRAFFLPKLSLPKTVESTDQASLIGLAELLPTFLCLSFALYFLSFGILSTDLNVPSRLILSSFFSFGLPNVFLLLIFVPAVIDNRLIKNALSTPAAPMPWSMSRNQVRRWAFACGILASLAPALFYLMPIGIAPIDASKQSHLATLMREARGYGASLAFLRTPVTGAVDAAATGLPTVLRNRLAAYQLMEFSPVGLKHLAALDVVGFQQAVRSLAARDTIGFLASGAEDIGVKLSPGLVQTENLGDIALAAKAKDGEAKNLRLLVDSRIDFLASEIHRNRMQAADLVELDTSITKGNFKVGPSNGIVATQWTSYMMGQIDAFNWQHVSVAAFLYLLLALYLNSFVRATILVGLLGVPYSVGSGLRMLAPGVFHADSLWLFAFVPWLSLVQLLVLARIADVERIRGHDRDLVVNECRLQVAPSVLISILFFPATLAIVGCFSMSGLVPEPGLWKEALGAGVIGAIITWLTALRIFPLFYLEAEETVERLVIQSVLRARALRRKIFGSEPNTRKEL